MNKSDLYYLLYIICTVSAPWVMIPLTVAFCLWIWVYDKFFCKD